MNKSQNIDKQHIFAIAKVSICKPGSSSDITSTLDEDQAHGSKALPLIKMSMWCIQTINYIFSPCRHKRTDTYYILNRRHSGAKDSRRPLTANFVAL
jgi:hypothetical protein